MNELRAQNATLSAAEEELRITVEELTRLNARAVSDRERYKLLFASTPTAYVVTDPLGVIRDANESAAIELGIEPRFLRNKPFVVFLGPNDATKFRQALGNGVLTEATVLRVTLQRRKGTAFDAILKGLAVDGGRRILWCFTVPAPEENLDLQEVTALRRALRDKEDLLARERRRREQLELADKAKDRFLAILSHDLRGPINATLGWTELLRRERLDGAGRERALATIERNARSQLALVEELLDVSRIVADKLQLDMRIVDLARLVARIADAQEPQAAARGATLRCSIKDGPFTVLADAKRLEQVVTNLVSNALKHTTTASTIDISLVRDGKHAVLTVADDGRGIAPELLPHIFECFKQGESYTASRSGLGLGLYIVRQLLDLHGGSIRAESEGLGKGATFTATLPLRLEVSAPAESTHELPEPDSLEGLRILVVDDEPDVRELLQLVLEQQGARVLTSANVDDAIDLCEALAPDVIVSDVAMPGADGCDLVRRLHASGVVLPLVAMSGFAATADIDQALSVGFDVHVAKPVTAADLIAAIHHAIELHNV